MAKAAFLAMPAYTLNKLCSALKKKNTCKLVANPLDKESVQRFSTIPPEWTLQIYWDLLKLVALPQQREAARPAHEQGDKGCLLVGMMSHVLKKQREGGSNY